MCPSLSTLFLFIEILRCSVYVQFCPGADLMWQTKKEREKRKERVLTLGVNLLDWKRGGVSPSFCNSWKIMHTLNHRQCSNVYMAAWVFPSTLHLLLALFWKIWFYIHFISPSIPLPQDIKGRPGATAFQVLQWLKLKLNGGLGLDYLLTVHDEQLVMQLS